MQITVKATTKESKQARGQTYYGVKAQDDQWYNLMVTDKPAVGAVFEIEVKTTEYQGKTYRWATLSAKQPAKVAQSNGHFPWEDYAAMVRVAHLLARELEPDETGTESQDRSQARIRFVNNVMMAFKDGKVALPKEDAPPPPVDDDDIPF
jgi:hypothetical protein